MQKSKIVMLPFIRIGFCISIQGGSEFGAVPAATDRSRQHRSHSTWDLVSRPIGAISFLDSCISLSRDFELVKVPGNPMKSPFCFGVFRGQILAITICARRRQPKHVKHLLSGLNNVLKGNFHSLGLPPGDPRVARCSHFRSEFCIRFRFFLADQNQRQEPTGA